MTDKFGKGFSVTNLKQMRQFYVIYSTDQFENLPSVDNGGKVTDFCKQI